MPDDAHAKAPARVMALDGATASVLGAMTFPAYTWLLPNARADGPVFAFAVTPPGVRRVVGLALLRQQHAAADLLSVFVAPTQRGRGFGQRLLDVVEETLATKGIATLGAIFDCRTAGGAKMAHMLERRGWSKPELRQISFKSDFAHAANAPWMRARTPPAGTRIVPWREVADGYETRIADPGAVPEDLHPRRFVPHAQDGAPLEPAGCFVLMEGEAMAGWAMCHRINSHDARITGSYMRADYERRFASGLLWRAAILGLRDAGYKYALWAASALHPRIVEFSRRHVAPIAISVSESVHMAKRLGAR